MRLFALALGLLVAVIGSAPAAALTWLDDPTPDTTPPVISVAYSNPTEATSSAGAAVSYTATATDETDPPNPAVDCNHPSTDTYPLGATTVTWPDGSSAVVVA